MKCSIPECVEEHTLYNINFALQHVGIRKAPEWRCAYHVPREATFIVAMFGEELEKAGR